MVYRCTTSGALVCETCHKADWQMWYLDGIQILNFLHMVQHERVCPGPVISIVEDSRAYALEAAERARKADENAKWACDNNHPAIDRFNRLAAVMADEADALAADYRAHVDAARAAAAPAVAAAADDDDDNDE